jgi:hypothetical protein
MLEHDYGSQRVVHVPLDKFIATCAELRAAFNIMGKALKYFNRADAADIRRHRAQCDALRGKLELLIPPMWHYHPEDNGDQP